MYISLGRSAVYDQSKHDFKDALSEAERRIHRLDESNAQLEDKVRHLEKCLSEALGANDLKYKVHLLLNIIRVLHHRDY